ncbi:hypothetical protein ACFPPD_08860 [Cohnella suwonensis]|uniref:Sulfotransferase domain-containing protein n=1 Tax=Cohnella suwonensis TaxID=696072 RepID=A0ABW0LVH0_9BACL
MVHTDIRLGSASFVVNSIPKSGTNLLDQMLLGIPGLIRKEPYLFEGLPTDLEGHRRILADLHDGEYTLGHLYHSAEWANMLRGFGLKQLFLIRDPRDVLVSLVYFILDKFPEDTLYPHLLALPTMKDRYLAVLRGVPSLDYPNFAAWLNLFLGWRFDPLTHVVTYESLVGSSEMRRSAIAGIAGHLWGTEAVSGDRLTDLVAVMEQGMNPDLSWTFRKGVIGAWKDEFDQELKTEFDKVAGELLIGLGYG